MIKKAALKKTRQKRSKTNILDLSLSIDSLSNLAFMDLLDAHLKQLDWSYEDLADETGISFSQISGWERIWRKTRIRDRYVSKYDLEKILSTLEQAKNSKKKKLDFEVEWFDDLLNSFLSVDSSDKSTGLKTVTDLTNLTSRYVSKEDINRIVIAITQAYDHQEKTGDYFAVGVSWMDKILNDFLSSAGYPAISGRKGGMILERIINTKTLRVGWFQWATLAVNSGASNSACGWSFNVVKRLSQLLGLQLELVDITLSNAVDKLISGEIDIISPMMELPSRFLNISASDHLDGNSVGINALCHKAHVDSIIKDISDKSKITKQDIYWDKLQIGYLQGGSPSLLKSLLIDNPDNKVIPENGYTKFSQGIEDIITSPIIDINEKKYIKCFIADEETCKQALAKYGELSTLVGEYTFKIPLVIATHEQEEKLTNLINQTLSIMKNDHFFKKK